MLSNYRLATSFLIAALLLTSFFTFQLDNAAYTPDLSIVRVSPCDFWTNALDEYGWPYQYHKLVPGYSVTIYNAGNGASTNTTMDFYIKTFDGKCLVKHIKVPGLDPGQSRRVSFSMNNQTNGSFKEGYALVNPYRNFTEVSYKNNLRHFGLKETILDNSTNVTEYYTYHTEYWRNDSGYVNDYQYFYVPSYNSPLSNHTGIYYIDYYCVNPPDWWYNVKKVRCKIPSSLAGNVTFNIQNVNYVPAVVDNETMQVEFSTPLSRMDRVHVYVNGTNLEQQGAIKEPLEILNTNNQNLAVGFNRHVWEWYRYYQEKYTFINQTQNLQANYSYQMGTDYRVHHENVTSINVIGNPRNLYVAGWFITPVGSSVAGVNALYRDYDWYGNPFVASVPATSMLNGRYGISYKIRDKNLIGFQFNGTNLQGFNNFKSLGFSSWTWRASS